MPHRILVVDDDASIREALQDTLGGDLDVRVADTAEHALACMSAQPPDIILSDVRMPGLGGLALLRLVRERAPGVDVVMMSAYDDMATVVEAMRDGAIDYLVKPLDLHDLRRVVRRLIEDRRLRQRLRSAAEGEAAGYRLNELVGRDPGMLRIYKLVGQVAATRATVLIRGESGTGKELIARAIHYNSADAAEPFVALNCTALPATLLESELFGHVKGAFTGAQTTRRGRFELAGRGSVFLDEIGDTSGDFQTKLLRVLQEHEYFPVGAERAERTEARIIAATHRPLEEMVARAEFRADLYYRLRVVEITVPPLRERAGDIPALARHLLADASREMHREPPVLSDAAVDVLLRHSWPGNVRELENCLTRGIVVAGGDVIRPEHLAIGTGSAAAPSRLAPLDEVEKAHIEHVLAAIGGRKSEAARTLGVSRPRLDRLLRKHNLQ